jgi:uncharacterized protein YbjT (DUF2867 family)
MTQIDGRTVVVIGATGNQGGVVVNRLVEAGGWQIRAASRDATSEKARALTDSGVEVRQADMDDPASLDALMAGADRLFFVPIVGGEGPPSEIARGIAVVDAAVRAGVAHVVFSGVSGGNREIGVPNFRSKGTIEEHLKSTGLHHTVLRPVSFMENFKRNRDAILGGQLSGVLNPEKAQQYVSVRDIAAFAVAALEDPKRFDGEAFDLAGDELRMPDLAALFTRMLGRTVEYNHIPSGEPRSRLPQPMLVMNDFFEREGYGVDVDALKARWGIPLTTMEEWIRTEPGWPLASA